MAANTPAMRSETTDDDEGVLGKVGGLLKRIGTDVKSIATDQVDLMRAELVVNMKSAALSAAGIILMGVVIAIAIGFLAVAGVVALEPLIYPLALRLVLMAVVYSAVSIGLVMVLTRRFKEKIQEGLVKSTDEAKQTVAAVKQELTDED